jgi:hypothetical protein
VRIVPLVLLSAVLGLGAVPLHAQAEWGLGVELGFAQFSGHGKSVGITPETSVRPAPTHTYGFRVDRSGRKVRFSLGLQVASTGAEFENEDAAAQAKGVLDLLEISPEVSLVIFQPREAAVRLHAGVAIDRWSPEGDDTRTTVGGLGGVSVELPFSSRVGVQVRWEGMLSGSVFDDDDLPVEFERENGLRQRWVVGLRYRL